MLLITQCTCTLGSEWDQAYAAAMQRAQEQSGIKAVDQRYVESSLRRHVAFSVRALHAKKDFASDVHVAPLLADRQRQLENPSLSLLTVVTGPGSVNAAIEVDKIMGAPPDGSSRWVIRVQNPGDFEVEVFNRLLYVMQLGDFANSPESSGESDSNRILNQELPQTQAQAEAGSPKLYRRL